MKLPVNLYADLGTVADDGILKQKVLYNAGVSVSIAKDVFEIFFPLLLSDDFNTYKKTNKLEHIETVRFTLNLKLMNPFDLLRNFTL